jgi:hypothetical protein
MKILHDREGQTLTVWFGEPSQEFVCEETSQEVVLMKDRSGHVISIEMHDFSVPDSESVHVVFETILAGRRSRLGASKTNGFA